MQIIYGVKERRKPPPPATDYEAQHEFTMDKILGLMPDLPMKQVAFRDETIPIQDENGHHYLDGKVDPKEDETEFNILLVNKQGNGTEFRCKSISSEIFIHTIIYAKDAREFGTELVKNAR